MNLQKGVFERGKTELGLRLEDQPKDSSIPEILLKVCEKVFSRRLHRYITGMVVSVSEDCGSIEA